MITLKNKNQDKPLHFARVKRIGMTHTVLKMINKALLVIKYFDLRQNL